MLDEIRERGWTGDPESIIALWVLLEWPDHPLDHSDFELHIQAQYAEEYSIYAFTEGIESRLIDGFVQAGLFARTMSGDGPDGKHIPNCWEYSLTDYGRSFRSDVLRRRTSPIRRAHARQDSILAWLYEKRGTHFAVGGLEYCDMSCYHYYEGTPWYHTGEVHRVCEYLARRGLIGGDPPPFDPNRRKGRLWIEDPGIECVEHYNGSVSKYLEAKEAKRLQDENRGGGMYFYGAIHGNVSAGNHGPTIQNYDQSQGLDSSTLARIVSMLREAGPIVAAADGQDQADAIASLAGELEAADTPTEQQTVLQRVKTFVLESGSVLFKTAADSLVKEGLQQLGIGA